MDEEMREIMEMAAKAFKAFMRVYPEVHELDNAGFIAMLATLMHAWCDKHDSDIREMATDLHRLIKEVNA